ncbi:hypothetical protein KEM56_007655, partial [Ascosphaera pollenicola]
MDIDYKIESSSIAELPNDEERSRPMPASNLDGIVNPDVNLKIGIRMAVFFSAASFSGSFGGLLAAAITQMDGVGGKPGWAWIFIIEGLATFVVGVISIWAVPPFPDDEQNRFLSDEDRARVRYRLAKDAQASANHEKYTMAYFWNSVKDWKTYTGMLILMGNNCPMYAFSLFLPTIASELGYSNTQAQFMSVPPYAVAAVATICVGYAADRLKRRGIFNIFFTLIGIAGFLMMMISREPKVKYAGTFLGALGIYPANINSIAWVANNVE